MKIFTQTLLALAAAAALAVAAPQTTKDAAKNAPAAKTAAKSKAAKAEATPAPTASEIADAKAKGLVWVNLETKVYHKEGRYYGATKHGKFMTEADATKAGYHAAKEGAAKKAATKDTGAMKTTDASKTKKK